MLRMRCFPAQANIAGTQVRMGGYDFEILACWRSESPDSLARTKKTTRSLFRFGPRRKSPRARGWMLFVIKVESGQVTEALTQSEEILRRRRHVKFDDPDNFDIKTADKFVEQFDSIIGDGRTHRDRHLQSWPVSGRYRRHEHHAGQRHRANKGDRCSQSNRCASERYSFNFCLKR